MRFSMPCTDSQRRPENIVISGVIGFILLLLLIAPAAAQGRRDFDGRGPQESRGEGPRPPPREFGGGRQRPPRDFCGGGVRPPPPALGGGGPPGCRGRGV